MPTATQLRDALDAAMDSNDPLYGDSDLRTATKDTLWQTLGDVFEPYTGSTTNISTSAPTVTDDSAHGYAVGDRWIDTTLGDDYTLVDATPGAAVWNQDNGAGGGGGGAPTTADYLVKTANGSLAAERVVTDTLTIAWDWGSAGQAKANVSDNSISYAKVQNVTTTDKVLGRFSSGAGNIEEIDCTAAGRALLDDASATAQRATLSAAPNDADFLVKTAHSELTGERVVTDTSNVTWDWATSGQAKANVVGVTDGAATALTIETLTDGKLLKRSGTTIASADGYAPVWATWTTGVTTSSNTGVIAGPTISISATGTYIIMAWGKQNTSAAATGVRPFLQGSGGLTVSDMLITVRCQYSANDEIQAFASSLGGIPLIGNGSTSAAPFYINGYLVVNGTGTLEVWVASEGVNNVTMSSCYVQLTRIA